MRDEAADGAYYPGLALDGDPARVLAEAVAEHRADVDVIVVLSHLGMDEDIRLAESVPGVDLILGGHSHTTVHRPYEGAEALVVQAGSYAEWVARLDVTVAPGGGVAGWTYDLHPVDAELASPSTTVQARLEELVAPHAAAAEGSLARAKEVPADADAARFVADAAAGLPGADAALFPEAAVAHAIPAGPVSLQDLFSAYASSRQPSGTPDMNALYLGRVSGADLARLAALAEQGWAYAGPTAPEPGSSFQLILPKSDALHPERLGLDAAAVDAPVFVADPWTVVADWARTRTAACLYLDADEVVPGCTPPR